MKEENIRIKSYWKGMVDNEYIMQNSDTIVVVLPGQGYLNDAPLLHYSYRTAMELGFDVLCINYGFQRTNQIFHMDTELDILVNESAQILNCCDLEKYSKVIFIGKSLGTIVQNGLSTMLPNKRKVHIYLTPVDKTFEMIIPDECLIFTGTGDTKLSSETLSILEAKANFRIIRIQDANHSLEVADTIQSVEILKDVVVKMKEYMIECGL